MNPLFDYQAQAIAETRQAIRSGARAPLIVMPTGAGKTRTGVELVRLAMRKGNRVLWVAHRRELVDQARESLIAEGVPESEITILRSGKKCFDPSRPLCVASTQTMLVANDLPSAKIVMFDEAHHYLADEWSRVADTYRSSLRPGLTATPSRSDNRALGDMFDALIAPIGIRELTDLGRLVPCDVIDPGQKMRSRTLAEDPVEAYREHANGTSAIVFCTDVAHAKETAARFMSVGIPSACVEGGSSVMHRAQSVKDFRAGLIRVLVNVYVLTEGFDAPIAQTCILARGCGNVSTYLQIVGRVLRAHPGKTRALLIDLCGAWRAHGLPDADREYSLDGEGIRSVEKPQSLSQCKKCGGVYRPSERLKPGECPLCGYLTKPKPVEVQKTKLSPVERSEVTSPAEKQSFFDWLCREQKKNGYAAGWIGHKYKARFGDWPVGMRESEESKARAA